MNSMSPAGPRVAVIYESLFGNTARVAGAVADGLRRGGADVTVSVVQHTDREVVRTADLLVLGAPTHAFSLSRPKTRADAVRQGADASAEAMGLREWLLSTPAATGLPAVATFDTRADKVRRLPFNAARTAARLARGRGFRVVAEPRGFVVDDVRGPVVAGELDHAVRWGEELAALAAEAAHVGGAGHRADEHHG